jgi:hypothetical protein
MIKNILIEKGKRKKELECEQCKVLTWKNCSLVLPLPVILIEESLIGAFSVLLSPIIVKI